MFRLLKLLFSLLLLANAVRASETALRFETQIRPIFREHCFDCHGATEQKEGGLDLRLVRLMSRGGESGPAIEPGDPSSSYLLDRIRSGEMPPGEHRVPEKQINIIERWIDEGAKTLRPEPATLGIGLGITPEERRYWAFQPIVRPPIPQVEHAEQVRTPIDALLLAEMEKVGLSFALDSPNEKLVRRAYLDLLGLPPTPEQVDDFLTDDSADAWEMLVDQLLDSPQYGERWARHWLDVAGYADSEGASNRDTVRNWAYKYRDWVIRAFNEDMPFDQFIRWQLAGDELAERPFNNMTPRQIDMLTATGFLRMASDGTAASNNEEARNQVIGDTLKIVSSTFLGLSVGCAQCHDHRYDPISQTDYYRLRAIFEPAMNYKSWLPPAARRISLFTDQDRSSAAAIENEAKEKVTKRQKMQSEFMAAALQAELAKLEPALRKPLEEAYKTPGKERSKQQRELLASHPNIEKLHPGVLYQYNQKNADKLKAIDKEIADIRSRKPKEEFLRVLTEPTDTDPPETRLFYRGDYRQPKHVVMPGGLTIAAPADGRFDIHPNENLPTTGRRLAYARRLTSGRHPLVARVIVNRIWMHHFGKGLVSTPDEFGKLGTSPSHTQLLDWLADEFMSQGWSQKHIHRMILRSTVFRQSSQATGKALSVDDSNRLYSHFPIRRLSAETIRDSILFVSGRLDSTQFGVPVAISEDDAGQVVARGDRQRRSLYLQVRRTKPVGFLTVFDAPVMDVNCARRNVSTVATQSLALMNSEFVLKFSKAFAERINELEKDDRPAIRRAWMMAYARSPSDDEVALTESYIQEQLQLLAAKKMDSPRIQALTNLCQVMLTSNEFLYLD